MLQEREKLKEEKKKYAERLKLWSRPREDMECNDLKVNMPLSPLDYKTYLCLDAYISSKLNVLKFACLQELPKPLPVKTRLLPELFGDALMVLEFLNAFGELFDLKDEFPDGVTLGKIHLLLINTLSHGILLAPQLTIIFQLIYLFSYQLMNSLVKLSIKNNRNFCY